MTTAADLNSSAVISLLPCPEDVERDDFISSGEGEHLRTFRNSVAVRAALRQAAISTDSIEEGIDALDDGVPLHVPVTEEQFCTFYCIVGSSRGTVRNTEAREADKAASCEGSFLSRGGESAPFAPTEGRPSRLIQALSPDVPGRAE